MKFTKKDLLILLIPLAIAIILTPFLPDKIPMQWDIHGNVNWYLDRKLSFLLGLLPYAIFKLYQLKKG